MIVRAQRKPLFSEGNALNRFSCMFTATGPDNRHFMAASEAMLANRLKLAYPGELVTIIVEGD